MILRLLFSLILSLTLASPSWAAITGSGSGGGAAANGTTGIAALGMPATVNAGDLLFMCVANKYPTNGPSLPTDAYGGTWVAPSNNQASCTTGGCAGTGAGVGATYTTVYYKVATGTEDGGSAALTVTSGNVVIAQILRYTNATGLWDIAAAQGTDTTAGTDWAATAGSDPGVTTDDMLVTCTGRHNTATFTLEVMTHTGVTYAAMAERAESTTTTGDDASFTMTEHTATAGSSSAAPQLSALTSASAGGTVFIRLRETSAAGAAVQSSTGFLGVILP